MSVKSFEDFDVWRDARELYKELAQLLKGRDSDDFLIQHIKRTIISISSNIAEGYERETNREFIRFLYMAKGSSGEMRSQLYLLYDANIINEDELDLFMERAMKLSRRLHSLIAYLKKTF